MVPPSTSAYICDLGPRPCDEDIMIVSLHLSCSESALPLLKRPGRLPLWQGLSERAGLLTRGDGAPGPESMITRRRT